MDRTYTLVRLLLRQGEEGFSRNKNFEAYREPHVQRAVKIFRFLRSVREDLLRVGDGVALERLHERPDGAFEIRLTFDDAQGRRMSVLGALEWELLFEDERLKNIMGDLLTRLGDADRVGVGAGA